MSATTDNTPAAPKWVWKAVGPQPAAPKAVDHRLKAVIQASVMSAVGAFLYWKLHRPVGACVIWSLAAVFLVCGLFIPPAFKAVDHFFFAILPKAVAAALNWLLLVPFFFLVFVPARFFLTLAGRDPMTRRVPTDLPTYWIPRKPVADLKQYKKQY